MIAAAKTLDVVIVGGGIAGFSAAIGLARSGRSVTLLESRDGLAEIGAGIQLQPNASRILCGWGLQRELEDASEPAGAVVLRRYATGEVLHRRPLPANAGVFPALLVFRSDLLRILFEAARSLGVEVKFSNTVANVDVDRPAIRLSSGQDVEADLILIAEGIGSKSRSCIVPAEQAKPLVSNNAYRVLIPRERMFQDASTASFMTDKERNIWFGPHKNAVSYPIAHGKYFNMVLEHPGKCEPGVWHNPVKMEVVKQTFSEFEPILGKLIGLGTASDDWACARLPPLPTWTSPNGRVLLIGDAAHATTPQLAQGAAMCIEDAAVLVECLNQRTEIASATEAFVKVRKSRVEKVQDVSWENSKLFTMPDGPEQEKRDQVWKGVPMENEAEPRLAHFQREDFLAWLNEYDAIAEAQRFLEDQSSQNRI